MRNPAPVSAVCCQENTMSLQEQPHLGLGGYRQDVDVWLERAPLVEVVFDDERLRALP